MSLFANCPLPTSLPAVVKQLCGVNYNQVVKIALWQKGQSPFTPTSILTAAAWSTANALTTAGKVIVTNYVNNFNIPNSTAVEQTADTNILAMPELQRGSIVKATYESRSLSAAAIAQLQSLTPFSAIQPGVTDLVAAFITSDGNVIWNGNGTDLGFPVYNWFVSDSNVLPQLGALNMVAGEFYLNYGWSTNLTIGTPAFDLLNTYPS